MKRIALLLLAVLAVVLSTGAALATPGSGISASTLGQATIDGKQRMRSVGLADMALFAAGATAHQGAAADGGGIAILASFDPMLNEFPEGLAVDDGGNAYVSIVPTGEIRRVTPRGAVSTYAQLPDPEGGFLLGMAFDRRGDLFATLASPNPAKNGVWKVSSGGAVSRFAALEAGVPNVPVLDDDGNMYVSDSLLGQIWRINKRGAVSVWKADPLLQGIGFLPPPFPPLIGANGMALDEAGRNLYVANTDKALIVRIRILPGGDAGGISVLAQSPLLQGADGLVIDRDGDFIVPVLFQDSIVRVSRRGAVDLIAQGGLLQNPAEVRLGRDKHTLYVTNFAVGHALFPDMFPGAPTPALLELDLEPRGE